MKQIYLTKFFIALVDDEDYEGVVKYKWAAHTSSNGGPYAFRTKQNNYKKKTIFMHREIMKCPDNMTVEHKDGDGLNYQKHNMINITKAENTRLMQFRKRQSAQ